MKHFATLIVALTFSIVASAQDQILSMDDKPHYSSKVTNVGHQPARFVLLNMK